MKRRINWWLEGWQYDESLLPNGRRQKKLVYTGEYYSFGLEKRALTGLKAAFAVLTVLLIAVYALAFALTNPSVPRLFVGACMLNVIPCMYLLIGVGCLMPVGGKLTFRDYRSSVVRIRWTSITIAALAGVGWIGGAVCLLRGGAGTDDYLWSGAMLLCCLFAAAAAALEKRFRPRLIPPALQ